MNPYTASASVQRSVAGKIWKGILVVIVAAIAMTVVAFFFCSGRVNRERYRSALRKPEMPRT